MPWVQVPTPAAWLVINFGRFPLFRLFVLLVPKNKMKVLTAMVLRSRFSQFLLFSEYTIMSQNFLNHLYNSSRSRRACQQSKTFSGILIPSRVFRSIPISQLGFIEIEVIRVWWGTRYCHNCSVSQDRRRFSNLQNKPVVLVCSPSLNAASFQFFKFFLRSNPGEDDSSSSIRYTNIFFHVELNLSIECLPLIVVFEILAHGVNQKLRILNFFVPKFWISMSYSVEYNYLFIDFSPRIACWALHSRCPRRCRSSEKKFFVSRKRMTPDTVPSTFHWHWRCNTDRKTFSFFCFSLSSNGFPIACFLYFLSLGNKITNAKKCKTEDSNTVWTRFV